jgi:hypothetical protein
MHLLGQASKRRLLYCQNNIDSDALARVFGNSPNSARKFCAPKVAALTCATISAKVVLHLAPAQLARVERNIPIKGPSYSSSGAGGGIHQTLFKVRFHHDILATNLPTNSLTKSPHKQMLHIFCLVCQSEVCLLQPKLVSYKLTKATLRASLSASLLQKCDGVNAALVSILGRFLTSRAMRRPRFRMACLLI